MNTAKLDVEFMSEGRMVHGWLFLPTTRSPVPGVVMTPGFGGAKERFIDHPYHEVFAAAGIASLIYDRLSSVTVRGSRVTRRTLRHSVEPT